MNNKYISDFQIVGSSVKVLKIKNDFVVLENSDSIKRNIDVSHIVGSVEVLDDKISGILTLNVKATLKEGKKKYSVDMSIEGCFSASAAMGEETFRKMLVLNGLTSLYSIARGFIQSTTSQTLIGGSVMLPMFNVAAYSNDLSNQNE